MGSHDCVKICLIVEKSVGLVVNGEISRLISVPLEMHLIYSLTSTVRTRNKNCENVILEKSVTIEKLISQVPIRFDERFVFAQIGTQQSANNMKGRLFHKF